MNRTYSAESKEKPVVSHVEDANVLQKTESGYPYQRDNLAGDDTSLQYDAKFEKRVIRKVDIRLLLILGALYSIALIDRTNLSAARVAGMAKELKLTVGERYSIATLVFFIPYIIFELPSNILLRKVGARWLLGTIAVLWGAAMVGQSFVTDWKQLVAVRAIVGFFESGFFPGCVFLISTWYTRWETQKRLATFYLLSMAISGFSNIICYGFALVPKAGILHTWRWIFFLFGIITIALGALGLLLIVDFPDKAKFLNEEERKFIIDRVNRDRGDGNADNLTGAKALKHLLDWRTWCFGLCFMSATLPSYAFAYFLPVILAGQGYSYKLTLFLSAPPYIVGAVYTFIIAFSSDKLRLRGVFVSLNALVTIVGCLLIGYVKNKDVKYFGAFLAIMGGQCNVPSVLAYQANNTITYSKKAVASAIVIGMGGIGGIMASTVYRQVDYPRYIPGLWATIGAQLLIISICVGLTFHFKSVNKQLDEGRREPIQGVEGFRYSI
ncbi:hypothetical protein QFC21_001743 [Naganishia friedmannii]|uniref:Uncharacterized protein n=1 Tax=Naganishia friedmannii TaxID=89922 RepID=A0ACC2W2C3_9TREE|nr:hypothetical protein QFC21_001743 [Naganishia friedmannii]